MQANHAGESTAFVAFMRDVIHANLQAHLQVHNADDGVKNVRNDVDQQILAFMREQPRINQAQLAHHLSCSVSTIQRCIHKLRGTYIERVGSDKTGFW